MLLVAVTFALLFVGCKGKKPEVSAEKPLITIHMVVNGMVFDENWDVFKLSAEKNNVTLKSVASKNDTDKTQAYNLMVASQNLPDIISYTTSDLELLGIEGGVIPLNDLIEKYAPNIKRFITEHPRLAKDMYALDGKIYVLPCYYDYENMRIAEVIMIRSDWLKKFNLPVPRTLPEMEKTLTTLLNGDPNGNGRKDEVGIFARGNPYDAMRRVLAIFGARQYEGAASFFVDNGKISYAPFDPTFRRAVETAARWYTKGLIDKELFTRGNSARDQLLSTNLGVMTSDWPGSTLSYNQLSSAIPGFELEAIPPLEDGNGNILSKLPVRNTHDEMGWSISSKAKDPVTVIKFMDWWFSEEGRRAWNFGIEGKHYTMVNGKPEFTDFVMKNPDKGPLDVLRAAGAQCSAIGVHQDVNYEYAWIPEATKRAYKMYSTPGYLEDCIPFLKYPVEEKNEFNKIMVTINQTTDEYVQKWMLGALDVNKSWDAYVKRVKGQEIDRALEIQQKAYERFLSSK